MGLCSKAWFALMRRNLLYLRRYWLSSIFEFILPWIFLVLLVWVRVQASKSGFVTGGGASTVDAVVSTTFDVHRPLQFHDYLTALQAQRVCEVQSGGSSLADFFSNCLPGEGGLFDGLDGGNATLLEDLTIDHLPWLMRENGVPEEQITLLDQVIPSLVEACVAEGNFVPSSSSGYTITGMNSYTWHIPLLKCDASLCAQVGESAEPYCERKIVGLAGDRDRMETFLNWVIAEYPAEEELQLFRVFDAPDNMDAYVQSRYYGRTDADGTFFPKLAMGIVLEQDDDDGTTWSYQLRPNATNFNLPVGENDPTRAGGQSMPDTSRTTNAFARTEYDACTIDTPHVNPGTDGSCVRQYEENGVLTFQRLLHDFILNQTSTTDGETSRRVASVSFVPFPTREYQSESFFSIISVFLTLLVTIGLLYPVASMVSYIVKEKQFRQKELMKMMSVSESDIGWSWFMTFLAFHAVTGTVAAILSSRVYTASSLLLLWIFWMFTVISTITFSMTIASFSSKATRAVLFAVLGFFGGFFLTLAQRLERGRRSLIWLISLHPVACFAYGVSQISTLEEKQIGLNWKNVGFSDTRSGYSFVDTLTMLLVDSVVWGVASWYFNRVITPDYGHALPFYFPFQPSYWFPTSGSGGANSNLSAAMANSSIPYEAVDDALDQQSQENKTIEIHNLRKSFGDKIAVDGLSLSIYSGHITALLGHNGAGKTTLISMLTGAVPPTDGHASIQGKDLRKDLSLIRKDIGICLQHDCLFPDLTVREHIQFFARLKGFYERMSVAEANAQIDQSIKDVALFEKRNTRSKALSGGMKRKLSLCMAFCGGSTVVLLDEPTSGMDPFSRRFTWDVIRQYRENRCIILTTHFMDEADILGDRIAIMADGQLRCAGSPLFLKKAYGVGYQLTIEKSSSETEENADFADDPLDGSDSTALIQVVKQHVPQAATLSNVGTELKVQLPVGSTAKFPALLANLDRVIDAKQATSYGVSMTTMDEVFLLVARGDQPGSTRQLQSSRNLGKTEDVPETKAKATTRIELSTGSMFPRHVGALVRKRAANFQRDKKAWCCTTLLPTLFVLIGFLVYMASTGTRNLPSLTLDIGELNDKVKQGPMNPVAINEEGSYSCLPGRCLIDEAFSYAVTGETYAYCLGAEQDLASCSVASPLDVWGELEGTDGISLAPAEADDVESSSQVLLDTADVYEATQYGAVWITKDESSTVNGADETFDDNIVAQCYQNVTNGYQYITFQDCDRLRGLGLLIQYNFTALHSAPLFQALADQAIARAASNNPNLEIKATIAPLPNTQIEKGYGEAGDSFLIWFLIILSFPFISGAYATFIVDERESKAKHLQTVAGVEPGAYWLSSFIWDILNYQLPLWITVGMMFAFDVDVLLTRDNDVFPAVLALLLLYGPAAAGYAYCTSFMFKSSTLCNVVLIISSFILALGGTMTVFVLNIAVLVGVEGRIKLASTIVSWVLRLFPAYNLAKGLFFALNISLLSLATQQPEVSAFTKEILLYELVALAIQGIGYTGLAVVLDIYTTNPSAMGCCATVSGLGRRQAQAVQADDSEVIAEESRVLGGDAKGDLIVMKNMSKTYSNGKVAVKKMSLGIAPGECFGLLGINGAGKTTCMAMLTAEFPPSSGDAILSGHSIVREPQKIRRRIGYCPQFDAHFANMTGREHVTLYASVKGVPPNVTKQVVSDKLQEVGLSDYDADRLCANYSGGMKRRLSIACATIGQPRIVFLDECSTGVDPVARREIWKMVSDMVSNTDVSKEERTSVILTTHSMEECEALCPRIGIMANGRLRCLGSAQHLKNKFGQGYQVEINAQEAETGDADYIAHSSVLARFKNVAVNGETGIPLQNPSFSLSDAMSALSKITNDNSLSALVSPHNGVGSRIYRVASSSEGVSLTELASFATTEMRMRAIGTFMNTKFPNHALRERQMRKVRYEISNNKGEVRISDVFAILEEHKKSLSLEEYGVSQTSLEQVFNYHAAEAEELKQGRNDR